MNPGAHPAGSRVALLRAATRDVHASIEGVPALARLVAPDLSRAEYVSVLMHLHAFHAAIEPTIAAALTGHPACALLDGSRLRALLEDLRWFDVAPLVECVSGLPDLPTVADALGALYVLEGASLGGRVIARHVADSLGITPRNGGSFYGGTTAETARRRWTVLSALLDAPVPEGRDRDWNAALVGTACAVFRSLERRLRRIGIGTGVQPLMAGALEAAAT